MTETGPLEETVADGWDEVLGWTDLLFIPSSGIRSIREVSQLGWIRGWTKAYCYTAAVVFEVERVVAYTILYDCFLQ